MAASTDPLDDLVGALVALTGAINNPRQDDVLLREAGVSLDRALFPLVVRLDALGPMSVAELAEHAGRDHMTISRQLVVLEREGQVERPAHPTDARVRHAALTASGRRLAKRIAHARRRLLGELLATWKTTERESLTRLARKMADDMARIRERTRAGSGG